MMEMSPENLARVMDDRSLCTILKKDISATVGIIRGDLFGLPYNVCVKRFPGRGLLDSVIKRLFRSRARHLWDISGRLIEKGLPVPAPVAYFDPAVRMQDTFFVAVAIENAKNLGTAAGTGMFDPPESLAAGLAATLASWHSAGAVHGDLKWSNILFQQAGDNFRFYLIDLDQAHICPSPCRKGICRDLTRFCRYGLELGHETWVENRFFPLYLSAMSMVPDVVPDPADIMRKARQEWTEKGRRRIRTD